MNGGRALAEMLRLAGAGPMFGMGGFQLLPFYDALRNVGLRHYLVNDERTGVFAADAYARVTNRPGVCDGTLGPGATNLVTGLVESLNAGIPLLALTGDTHRAFSGRNMTQECRQAEILRPAAKELIRIELVHRIPELVRRALSLACAGRPGPVVLDVPEDVCHGEHTFVAEDFAVDPTTVAVPARRSRPARDDIERAATLLATATRPLLLAGGGIHLSMAYSELTQLAESEGIPVAHTMSGKGSMSCTHPLSAGIFGRYSRIANDLIAQADCLLVAGCKLGEIATRRYALLPPRCPIIHLDIDAQEIGRHYAADVALWGDAREGLGDLNAALADTRARRRTARKRYASEVAERNAKWRQESMPRLTSSERPINIARICHELNQAMPPEAILVADGGFAAHWTSLLFDTKASGRHYVANRGAASIGYGVPAAIGVSHAAPDRPVVAVTGDGGLNMALGDLETARRSGVCPTIIVINNAASGYVKALQHAMYGGAYQSSDLAEMDYAGIARAMDCRGYRIHDPDDFAAAVARAMRERDRPTVLDVVTTRDPGKMLPGIDSRTRTIAKDDRVA
jgi:acetolactate synthase-1/2/3 large subunit